MQWVSEHGRPHSWLLKWNEEDQAKLRAYLLEESTRCAMCGTQPYEWDPAEGGSRRAYMPITKHCAGCYARAIASEDNNQPPGSTIQLVPYSDEIVEKQRQMHEETRKAKKRGGRE